MTTETPLDFLWFIPSSGDGAYLGSDDLSRPADPGYFREIAKAVDRLGYSGVLIPTGVACEESFILAADLAAHTERLKFLVAIRPGRHRPPIMLVLPQLSIAFRTVVSCSTSSSAAVHRNWPETASFFRMTNATTMLTSSSRFSTL